MIEINHNIHPTGQILLDLAEENGWTIKQFRCTIYRGEDNILVDSYWTIYESVSVRDMFPLCDDGAFSKMMDWADSNNFPAYREESIQPEDVA